MPDSVRLFGGPRNLLEMAVQLASQNDPPSERLACHPDDYHLANLRHNGPVTYVALRPSWRLNPTYDPALAPELPRKCALEPDPRCPRGEVWVADCLLGRIA